MIVGVIALAYPDGFESGIFVQRDGGCIARAHFEKHERHLTLARQRDGLDTLVRHLDELVSADAEEATLLIPHSRQDLLRAIREGCSILDEDYGDAGVRLHVKAPRPMHDLIANWIF